MVQVLNKLSKSVSESFTQFFQKIADSKGRAFWRSSQRAKHYCRKRAFSKVNCALAQEKTFCDKKGFLIYLKPIINYHNNIIIAYN